MSIMSWGTYKLVVSSVNRRGKAAYTAESSYWWRKTSSKKVEVELPGPQGLYCTAAVIWYVCSYHLETHVKHDKFNVRRRFHHFPANRSAEQLGLEVGGSKQ